MIQRVRFLGKSQNNSSKILQKSPDEKADT